STAEKVLVELISSDVAWLATIDTAIRTVLKLNKRARANPKALKQLDDHKRPIVNSLDHQPPALRPGKDPCAQANPGGDTSREYRSQPGIPRRRAGISAASQRTVR